LRYANSLLCAPNGNWIASTASDRLFDGFFRKSTPYVFASWPWTEMLMGVANERFEILPTRSKSMLD